MVLRSVSWLLEEACRPLDCFSETNGCTLSIALFCEGLEDSITGATENLLASRGFSPRGRSLGRFLFRGDAYEEWWMEVVRLC